MLLLGKIHTSCDYNVIILVACATKRIYDVVKNYKNIMKNQDVGKMKHVIVERKTKIHPILKNSHIGNHS
jgi:hypothetical protein